MKSLVLATLLLLGCQPSNTPDASTKPHVVVTTTMLGDLTRQLAGEDAEVVTIMTPGGDPHLYQPRPSDAQAVARSALVVVNGLHLEGWIERLLKNAGGQREIIVASQGVDVIVSKDAPGGVDPHFWFDVSAFAAATHNVERGLQNILPDDADQRVAERAKNYRERLGRLHAWAQSSTATIPDTSRVLVTSHDAFGYFGRAYGLDVVGIQGVSTEQEASQRDVANVIDLVRQKHLPAVFIEASVNPGLVEQVSRETKASALGPLYSDSLGGEGSGAHTYEGMVVTNVRLITTALGGTPGPWPVQP